jgi:hypothetical protein
MGEAFKDFANVFLFIEQVIGAVLLVSWDLTTRICGSVGTP